MEEQEWQELIAVINNDIGGIVHSQRVLDDINAELAERQKRPIEEDFIDAAVGSDGSEAKIFEIEGVTLQIRKLHRRGLRQRDIKGADLLYEIAGRKFVLVQYKLINGRRRVEADHQQLDELIAACPNRCPDPNAWPTCGGWFAARCSNESAYLPACIAKRAFNQAQSRSIEHFGSGLSHDVFQQLFARCWTGARIAPTEMAYRSWSIMQEDRVLVSVLQRGSFGRW
ncbi:MAG: hypothetical protein NTW74_12035 [Acidobacteria bacterium]|nr:hypothetical protein [Acidobacteriota bacterium]